MKKNRKKNPDGYIIVPDLVEFKEICGKELSKKEYKFFKRWIADGNLSEATKAAGIKESDAYFMMNTEWFKKAKSFFFQVARDCFHASILSQHSDVSKGFVDVIKGSTKDSKIATATISGAKLFMESGETPIIEKKTKNIKIDKQQINMILDPKKIGSLSQEELLEFQYGGEIPEEYRKK